MNARYWHASFSLTLKQVLNPAEVSRKPETKRTFLQSLTITYKKISNAEKKEKKKKEFLGDGEARLSSCRVQRVKHKMASYLVDKDSCIFGEERAWTALIRLKGEHGSRNSARRNLKHDSMWTASDFSGGRGCKRGACEPLPACGTKKSSPSLVVKGLRGWRMNRWDKCGVKTKKETVKLLEWNHLASSCASVNEAGICDTDWQGKNITGHSSLVRFLWKFILRWQR